GLQLVHEDLSRDLRPVRLGRVPGRPPRDRAPARVASLQSLSDVVLVALHRRPALGDLGREAGLRGAARPRHPRAARRRQLGAPPGLGRRRWGVFFRGLDRALKGAEAVGLTPWRKAALRDAEAWILERLEDSDGLGAILPPIINTIFAFRCLGYAPDDPRLLGQ